MPEILRIASQISTPLGLAGFAFAAMFLIIHQLIKSNKIPKLSGDKALKIVDRMFALAVVAMTLGFIGTVYAKPRNLTFRGAVLSAETGHTIKDASVIILGRPEFYPVMTDDNGSFTLSTMSYERSIEVVAQVRHPLYKTWSENRSITENSGADIIRLRSAEKAEVIVNPPVNKSIASTEYETRWVKTDESGRELVEVFGPIQTENRHNRDDIIATDSFHLTDPSGRIYSVEYSCQGHACPWSYHPNGGYAPSVQISGDGRSFIWFRKWDGNPAMETYRARYEVPKRVCVKNCG